LVAIANPQHKPPNQLARRFLRKGNVYGRLERERQGIVPSPTIFSPSPASGGSIVSYFVVCTTGFRGISARPSGRRRQRARTSWHFSNSAFGTTAGWRPGNHSPRYYILPRKKRFCSRGRVVSGPNELVSALSSLDSHCTQRQMNWWLLFDQEPHWRVFGSSLCPLSGS
jgi:hypothetical protein